MLSLPSSFPSDSISDAISIITSGTISSRSKDFATDAWVIGGYGLYVALPNSTQPSDEQKDQLSSFANHLTKAHGDVTAHLAAHATSKKFGDGTFLKIILQYLPTILNILKGIGIGVPTIPGLPTA